MLQSLGPRDPRQAAASLPAQGRASPGQVAPSSPCASGSSEAETAERRKGGREKSLEVKGSGVAAECGRRQPPVPRKPPTPRPRPPMQTQARLPCPPAGWPSSCCRRGAPSPSGCSSLGFLSPHTFLGPFKPRGAALSGVTITWVAGGGVGPGGTPAVEIEAPVFGQERD